MVTPQRKVWLVEEPEIAEFTERLNIAVENHPEYKGSRGKFTWFRDLLQTQVGIEITSEGARKWLLGRVRVPLHAVRGLAQALRVDPSWLAFGHPPSENIRDPAAVFVATALQQAGAAVAASEDGDTTGVSLISIIRGRPHFIYATMAQSRRQGDWQIMSPIGSKATDWVVVIPEKPTQFRFLHIDPAQARRIIAESGDSKLILTPGSGGTYHTDGRIWPNFDPETF